MGVSPAGPLVWNEALFAEFAFGREGDVAQMLLHDGLRVLNQARRNATGAVVPGARNPGSRGPRVRTGRLRSSIAMALGQDSQGLFLDVGTNVTYARHLETGLRGGRTYPFLRPALLVLLQPD